MDLTPLPIAVEPTTGDSVAEGDGGNRSKLAVLFMTVFLDLLGFGIVIPLLQLYAKRFDASAFQVGMLMASYSAMQFIFAPMWGKLSDRVGRRPVLLISIAGSCLAYSAFALAGSYAVVLLARTFAGICGGNVSAAQAYVADVTGEKDRARGMGVLGAAFGMGFVLGPAVAGFTAGHFGHRAPFWVAAGFALLNLMLAFRFLPESRKPGTAPKVQRSRAAMLSDAFRNPTLRPLLIVFFLVTLAFAQLESTFSMWLAEPPFHYAEKQVGYIFAYIGILLSLVQGGLVGRLSRKLGEAPLIQVGTALVSAGMLLLPTAHRILPLLGWVGLVAVGNGVYAPATSALLSRRADPGRQGETLGLAHSVSSLGRILGPLLGGLLFGHIGPDSPYITGGILMGLVSLMMLTDKRARSGKV